MRILVATDGSGPARQAALLAARLAKGGGVTLVHAVASSAFTPLAALDELSNLVSGSPGSLAAELELARDREGMVLLERERAVLEKSGAAAKIETVQYVGRPATVVLATAAEGAFDLVALGSHGHGTLARAFLGSVSNEVLGEADRPVLFARGDGLARFVVGVDGSAASVSAARFAGELARAVGATVTLLFAAELSPDSYVAGKERVERAFRDEARRAFGEARAQLDGVQTTEELVFHEPANALLDRARAADLVVVGRRGQSRAAELLLGSVSRKVALHASSSVVVVP